MYRKLEDFINDWTFESESTLKIFNNLTDESLTKKVNENVRTAGRLAWHITTSIGEMAHRTGLTFKTVDSKSEFQQLQKKLLMHIKRHQKIYLQQLNQTGMMKHYLLKMICMVKCGKEELLLE